jgi:hypothetical protein
MAIVLKDRVKETTSTTGTSNFVLGGASSGYQAFSVIGANNFTYYCCFDNATGDWEVGYGQYTTTAGGTLVRTTVLSNSAATTNKISFAAGPKDVFVTYPAEKAIYEESDGNVIIDAGPITVVGTGVTGYTTFGAALGELYANTNGFAQLYAQNLNSGSSASTDIVAYNNLGDGTNNFIDMGISSSNYTEVAYPIFTPASGYLYNDGGELIIGTATAAKDVLLFSGGVAASNWAARISGTNQSITTKAGLTLGGALTGVGGTFTAPVTSTSSMVTPGATEFVTRTYVDDATSNGFHVHTPVLVATTGNLTATYNQPGGAGVGVGATLTNSGTQVALSIDGVAMAVDNRILVWQQTSGLQNGIYVVTTVGSGSTNWVLTRSSDANTSSEGDPGTLGGGDYFFVESGTTQGYFSFVCNNTSAIVFGTTAITFAEFSSVPTYTGTAPINVSGSVIALTGTVAATNGGTGVSTVTTGDLLYGSGTNTWAKLPVGSGYRVLTMNAGGTQVEWNAVALNQTNAVSGSLGATNGGTGQNAYAVGDILYSGTTNTLAKLAGNTTTTKKFLGQTGTGSASQAPSWQQPAATDITGLAASATTDTTSATNITSGTLPTARLSGSYTGITGVGTLAAGTWNGSAIAAIYGGTGQTSYAVGDLVYANTTTTLAKLADVAVGNALISGGVGSAPTYGKIGLATHVSGTLPVANGGTGATDAAGIRTAAGATTVGGNVFTLTNPSAITFPRFNADNTVSALDAATFRTAIGAGTSSTTGTVTSVSGTGTVSGLTLTGTVTGSGSLTLGGTISTLNQNTTGTAANVTGVVAAANGGTGQSSYVIGDLLYASTTTALSKLPDVATGNALISGGVGVAPGYGKIGLTTHISGTLATGNGGTGSTATAYCALGSNVSGTLPVANGGTGTTTAQGAMNAFAGAVTSGQYLRGNGTNVVMSAIQAGDVPTLNQSTTGNAATATTLQTARTINLASFNGASDITIPRVKSIDDRAASPADGSAGYATFGFGSWNNNNTSPYADNWILRSYTDDTGGADNMVSFRKDALGMRVWQQTFGSATNFSSFKDVAWTDGTNSSGTWGISITGNAATASAVAFNNLTSKASGTGTYTTSGDYRAPIFYDSNDTSYYVDPNSNSRLVNLGLGGVTPDVRLSVSGDAHISAYLYMGGTAGSVGSWSSRLLSSGGSTTLNTSIFEVNRVGYGGGGSFNMDTSGNSFASNSFRAPIFYDSNDTTYYVDPASTTYVFGSIQNNGAHGNSFIQNRLLASNNGAGTGEVQLRMWCSEPGVTWDWAGFGYNVLNDGGSPGGFGRVNGSFGQAYMRMSNSGDWLFYNTTTGASRSTTMQLHATGYVTAFQSSRAPIFYDSDNTGYYLDPTSTQSLRTVGDWRANSSDWTGEFAGKMQYHSNNWYLQFSTNLLFRRADGTNVMNCDSGGNVTFTGNVTAYSDARIKENVVTIDWALDKVLKLRGVYYNKIDNLERRVGVIAQEIQEVLPEVVRMVSDTNPSTGQTQELLAVDYGNITGLLIEAIKELSAQVDELQKRI